jgi:hypothetical protein
MFRRFGISLTLLFTFLLVQGHNLIPHQHHEDEHHSATHHHDHEEKSNDEDVPFHGAHPSDFGKVLVKSNELKKLLLKPSFLPVFTQVPELHRSEESPPLIRPPVDKNLLTSILSYSVPLRAPPVVQSPA